MAILSNKSLDFTSTNIDQTERLGIRMGELLQAGDLICFYGDLGSGKTAMARGIARGWGTALRVTSPTYTLINEYPRRRDGMILYHLDFYRLSGSYDEIATTGVEDIFENEAAFMVEWAERIEDWLASDRIEITLRYNSETRRDMRIEATGERSSQLLLDFRKSAFGV